MGSYSAPAFALGYYKADHTVTNADGDVLIDPFRCADFMARYVASALYDGDIYCQLQKEDLTWFDFLHNGAMADQWFVLSPQALALTQQTTQVKYPYVVRFEGRTKPTVGSCVVNVVATPAPANPLW